jgi:tetrahydromethanopterin S-methyltransferase subunit B
MDKEYEIINNNNNDVVLSEIMLIKEEIKEIKKICNIFLNQANMLQQSQTELVNVIKDIISNNDNNLKEIYKELE